jgi:hypothetical protein
MLHWFEFFAVGKCTVNGPFKQETGQIGEPPEVRYCWVTAIFSPAYRFNVRDCGLFLSLSLVEINEI